VSCERVCGRVCVFVGLWFFVSFVAFVVGRGGGRGVRGGGGGVGGVGRCGVPVSGQKKRARQLLSDSFLAASLVPPVAWSLLSLV
jgi:hypothetical protein